MSKTGNIITEVYFLKNMNTTCCVRLIRRVLQDAHVEVGYIRLGEVSVSWNSKDYSPEDVAALFKQNGFPVIKSKEEQLVEVIKNAVIELIHYSDNKSSIIRNSDYLVDKTGYSYQHLSAVFSQHTSMTLEKFIIHHKIEKVKELIESDEMTLSEIAWQMGYSSVQYLSSQFKKIAGVTVSEYKNLGLRSRRPLDEIA